MLPTSASHSALSKTFSHFQTFVWLRWRIRINQLRHGSSLGKALAAILLGSFLIAVSGIFIGGVVMGVFVPRLIPRENYFLLWDGLVAIFCFVWVVHVATDVQRSDAVTFDRILHLPVAFAQAFAINYLSSLISLTLISLCAFSIGFTFGSCFSIGPVALLFAIPFLFFLIAVTALTYQLQGWLAALMSNPRRRQFVMIALPMLIIVISQLPAIIATRFARNEAEKNGKIEMPPPLMVSPPALSDSEAEKLPDETTKPLEEERPADAMLAEIVPADEKSAQVDQVAPAAPSEMVIDDADERNKRRVQQEQSRASFMELWIGRLRLANLIMPPFWMAGCVDSIMSGSYHVFWLTGAMALVGFVSLRRNYRQTLRYYKGETDSRASQTQGILEAKPVLGSQPTVVANSASHKLRMVERSVPFVSEETSAVITMTLQAMIRAPEVKLYLLLPLIAPFILFGFMQAWRLPPIDELKSGIIVAFTSCSLFITSGLLGNLFAYDRAGFRAFVLSPIRRERILLGRNLSTAPFLLLQSILLALAVGCFFGLAIDKLVCSIILSAAILPLFCLLTNVMSILTPFPLAAGSIQPKQFNLVPVLFSLVLSMTMPAMTGLALLPLGLEWLIDRFFPTVSMIPFALLLSVPWLAASLLLYRWLLPWEGKLLANREKELLRIVTSKIE